MLDEPTVRLACECAAPEQRFQAAQQLAERLGATSLLAFVGDPVVAALVPAPGFPQTVPGGAGWRALLTSARQAGAFEGSVAYPTTEVIVPALALSEAGLVLVFTGGVPRSQLFESVRVVMPLLSRTLRAEQEAAVARGEQQVAQHQAHAAETLARALDAARSELERTLIALEIQTGALEEARTRAEDAGRAKDEFLAMLGHELRNPLSPIVTALQILRLKNQTSREHDVIERQVRNLMRLVDDLLDVSRITRGKIELRKERLELANVAARAIELASPELEKNHQTLVFDVPERGLVVEADAARLAQVFANLLINAAKYSGAGTRIAFSAERDDSCIRARVTDQGIGIHAEFLDRVFDLFEQQPQAIDRASGGLGLGLAIVRSLVTLHGGTVSAASEGPGKGSEFVVELPAAQPAPPQDTVSANELRATLAPDSHRERVLVVDDNPDALMMLAEALTSIGHVVRTASDGPTALQVAQAFDPDIALVDIGLPVMDGYEVAAGLREPGRGRPRLIAVTGYGEEAHRLRSAAAGFDAHMVKPIALEQLQQVLEDLRAQVRG